MFQISAATRDAVPLNQGRRRSGTRTKLAQRDSELQTENAQTQKQRINKSTGTRIIGRYHIPRTIQNTFQIL